MNKTEVKTDIHFIQGINKMIYGYLHDYVKTMYGDGKNNATQIQTNSKFMQNLEMLI